MRLIYQDDFKKGYVKIKGKVADPASLNKNLHSAVELLRLNRSLSLKFATNRITPAGPGWYDSYIYTEKRLEVIIIYLIEGECVKLAQIGDAKELMKNQRMFWPAK